VIDEFTTTITPAVLRLKAMDLLARREHSRHELADKLKTKFVLDGEHLRTLNEVLEKLIEDDLLSDQRFAEALVRSKLHKGQGPRRIIQELIKRGVTGELAAMALDESGADWHQLAASVAHKKYGDRCTSDVKEKARRSRFLQYRGFDANQIAYALSQF
jgi:regulatory protein